MNAQSADHLIEMIQVLENTSSQLNDVLKKEQDILKSNDSQELLTLSKEKKALVSSLESHTKTTHIFLRNMNINKGLYGLSDFLSQIKQGETKTRLTDLWLNIQSFADTNKKLNDINGSIIELNRRHTQRSLDVLRGQTGSTTSTYGADGQTMKGKTSNNLSIA